MAGRIGSASHQVRVAVFAVVLAAACGARTGLEHRSRSVLTVGVGPLPSSSPLMGLRQLVQILSTEPVVRFTDDGRPIAGLGREWTTSPDRRSVRVTLRDGVTFHDGSPAGVDEIVASLNASLPGAMGPAFADVKSLRPSGRSELEFTFTRASAFMLEALETAIQKPGTPGIGTGPYKSSKGDSAAMDANEQYYLGRPEIDRLVMHTYPSTRAAWAEMLRGKVDMLFEVDLDAIDSLEGAKGVRLFKFTRRYQMMIVFNAGFTPLAPASVRTALNNAIDRDAVIKESLGGFAEPSVSPVWAHHWAYPSDGPQFSFAPANAAAHLPLPDRSGVRLRFTCLVPQAAVFERVALAIKKQLAQVGVDMELVQVDMNELVTRLPSHDYQAALVDAINGPTMFRLYEWWHSGGSLNVGRWSHPNLDLALDQLRDSASDVEYARAVRAINQAAVDDPPALFLAWGQRARAISSRFDVPVEPGHDVLTTIRLWKPAAIPMAASRN